MKSREWASAERRLLVMENALDFLSEFFCGDELYDALSKHLGMADEEIKKAGLEGVVDGGDEDCPLGGDPSNGCDGCVYSLDYHFVDGECVRREEDANANEHKAEAWAEYLKYLAAWAIDHSDAGHYGASPACFGEWMADEYEQDDEDDE